MALAALLLVVSLQSASGPTFEIELWPGEGRPVFAAVVARLELRERPSASAGVVAAWTGRIGQTLAFDDTLYRTVKSGRLIALGPRTITGRDLGESSRLSRADYYTVRFEAARVNVKIDEPIEYLQYRAEGTCFVRVANRTIDADPCPAEHGFRLEVQPEIEWWIHIVDGSTRGWLLVTDATARVVRRGGSEHALYAPMFEANYHGGSGARFVVQDTLVAMPTLPGSSKQFDDVPIALRRAASRTQPTRVKPLDLKALPAGVRTVPAQATRTVIANGTSEAWEAFRRQHNASGWLAFSDPLLDPAGLNALVYYQAECGGLCGETGYAWLQRDSAEAGWRLRKKIVKLIK